MSVAITFRVETRPWRGYDDPSLPEYQWFGQGLLAGDASGGTITVDLLFKFSGQALNGQLWNVEQLAVSSGEGTLTGCSLITLNLDFLTNVRAAALRAWTLPLTQAITNGDAQTPPDVLPKPLFLGQANGAALVAGLRFVVDNAAAGQLNVSASGYVWGPRSVMAPGGIQRPVGALFGA